MSPTSHFSADHFRWEVQDGVGLVELNRPERKNPLTFESYGELTALFEWLKRAHEVKVVILRGAGENFCSGGDVHEIIGPLVAAKRAGDEGVLLRFTRMTGGLVASMRECPQPIIAAVDGVCAGAGAILAMASDLRIGSSRSRVAFLFTRVGLSGADMGACALLPRIIGQGRASDLLYTGRFMLADEAERWGFYNKVVAPQELANEAHSYARALADGPTRAHAYTKACLREEWNMSVADALEHEARSQASCMMTNDFERAYEAFVARTQPVFKGD